MRNLQVLSFTAFLGCYSREKIQIIATENISSDKNSLPRLPNMEKEVFDDKNRLKCIELNG